MNKLLTADSACIVRVWVERGDPVLRGRIARPPDTISPTARGIEALILMIREQLEETERELIHQVEGP